MKLAFLTRPHLPDPIRADGTCTRCPMQLRLKKEYDTSWRCQVNIRWEKDEIRGVQLDTVREEKFGPEITDPLGVEDWVRRAQKAVLNPSTSSSEYLGMYEDDNVNELRFSQNVVCINVVGNNLPNLSLMDLPGIIRHTEDGDMNLVKMIMDAVDWYISRPNSIIIATITCKDDIENQEIVQKARIHDPEGKRTLGVLTKPDTIESGCHEKYFNIIA
ncbi:P-loop containing nucleoside triphosphate hydrolase protein, partial [Endogone sp. FLAS-F59071]